MCTWEFHYPDVTRDMNTLGNALRLQQNGRHAYRISKNIGLNENDLILLTNLLKFLRSTVSHCWPQ